MTGSMPPGSAEGLALMLGGGGNGSASQPTAPAAMALSPTERNVIPTFDIDASARECPPPCVVRNILFLNVARVPLDAHRVYDARDVKLLHWIAGGAVVAVLPVFALPGCESLLGLDGYRGAATELCELYEQCYGTDTFSECLDHVDAQLERAEAGEVTAWLTKFGSEDCLESCGVARSCLDLDPVCGNSSFGCAVDEQCCGFTTGLGGCLDAACCKDDGAECGEDAECCGQVCAAPPGSSVETCGGVVCANTDEACEQDPDCCTDVCNPDTGLCAPTCIDQLGAACSEDIDCCSRSCQDGECACVGAGEPCDSGANCCGGFCGDDGTCKEDCGLSGVSCDSGDGCCSGDCLGGECCGGSEDSCQSDAECCGQNCVLGECACSRKGAGCLETADCCPAAGQCVDDVCVCAGPDELCSSVLGCCAGLCLDGSCRCARNEEPCEGEGDCCSGVCASGTCTCLDAGADCGEDADCCSDRCFAGSCCVTPPACGNDAFGPCNTHETPLNPPCLPNVVRACVVTVCSNMPSCCCNLWDQTCVQAYEMTACGASAATGCDKTDPAG